ncbi:hypothetical protein ABZX51_010841 [Aspergillus tubingensis]
MDHSIQSGRSRIWIDALCLRWGRFLEKKQKSTPNPGRISSPARATWKPRSRTNGATLQEKKIFEILRVDGLSTFLFSLIICVDKGLLRAREPGYPDSQS